MSAMRMPRALRAVAIAAAALVLVSCAGLPMAGPVENGLPVGGDQTPPEFDQVASGPVSGAEPEEIVEGFLEAAITPGESWRIARQFLAEELALTWKPLAGVTIDETGTARTFTAEVGDGDRQGDVRVQLAQVAGVDESGMYTRSPGMATMAFHLVQVEGEWRIDEAPDGILLDEVSFGQVYEGYALQFWDQSWSRLVPDVRWYPKRKQGIATTITQALLTGPSEWLKPAVRSFPADVSLAKDSVIIDRDQVADVALGDAALALDATTLARLRTQLEQSLSALGVTAVRLTVDGQNLQAGTAAFGSVAETGTLVFTEDGFGTLSGGGVEQIAGISDAVISMGQPLSAVDVGPDEQIAAIQVVTGEVHRIADGAAAELDARPELVRPSLDRHGYVWSVPADDPQALIAWDAAGGRHDIADAWPEASSITAVRVAADGARIAALLTTGGERHLVVASIVRDEDGVPVRLGGMRDVTELERPASALVWLGTSSLGVLLEGAPPAVLSHEVSGPGSTISAPAGTISMSGARTSSGVRLLGDDGVVYARRGTSWQESASGVLLLGTRAGL